MNEVARENDSANSHINKWSKGNEKETYVKERARQKQNLFQEKQDIYIEVPKL